MTGKEEIFAFLTRADARVRVCGGATRAQNKIRSKGQALLADDLHDDALAASLGDARLGRYLEQSVRSMICWRNWL
jgi:hypothetical protein